MSIQSEITRISGNVSDAFTAITNKGVTVPAGSKSDNLAYLILQIASGVDGNNLSYGYTSPSAPYVGIAEVGTAVI